MLKYGPYSPSRLECAECPLRFNATYINPVPGAKLDSLPQARGKAVHEVLEQITRLHLEGKTPTPSDVRHMCAVAANKSPAAIQEMDVVLGSAFAYLSNMPAIVRPENVIGVEYKAAMNSAFQETAWDAPDAAFRYICDVVTGDYKAKELYVMDHKTQMFIDRRGETFQMGFYAWGMKKLFPWAEKIYTALHFCREELNTYSTPHLWSDEDLQRVENNILARIETIETTTNWKAVPNGKCQYCPLTLDCPVLKALRQDAESRGIISDLAHKAVMSGDALAARELAGILHVRAETQDGITAALQEHVKNNGPVAIPGKIFAYHVDHKTNWNYNKSMLFNTLEEHSFDPFAYFNADTKKLTALLKKAQQPLAEKLRACAVEETGTKWGAK